MKVLEKHIQKRKSLCFIDLEGTQFSHEMIAIGAVKVDIRKDMSIKKIHKGYYSLVKAKNKIGKIVTDLTGITEQDLKKDGIPFRVAISNLKKYLGRSYSNCLFIAFGNHDARIISQSLAYNLDANKDDVQIILKHYFDFADFASQFVKDEKGNTLSLSNMLNVFGVDFEGTQHNALADAYNLAQLYGALLKSKPILKTEYKKVLGLTRHLPEPLHELILKLLNGETVTPEMFDKMVDEAFKWSTIQME